MEEKKELRQGLNNLNVVGEIKLTDKVFNLQQKSKNNENYIYNSMNLYVNVGNGDTKVSMFGGIQEKIYVHGVKEKDGRTVEDWDNRFTVDWSERNDVNVKRKVANSCFIRIRIQKDENNKLIEKTFLAEYDAIEYLNEHLKDNMRVYIGGNLGFNPNLEKDTMYNKNVKTIYLQETSDDKYKPHARFKLNYLITKDSIDTAQISTIKEKLSKGIKDDLLLPVKGYVVSYVGKVNGKEIKKTLALPLTININPEKLPAFDKMVKLWFRPQGENVISLELEGNFVSDGNTIDVKDVDLDDDVKFALEAGLLTEEDIVYKAVGNNNRTFEYLEFFRPETQTDKDGKLNVKINTEAYTTSDLLFLNQFIARDETAKEKDEIAKDIEKATEKLDTATDTADDIMAQFSEVSDVDIDDFFAEEA